MQNAGQGGVGRRRAFGIAAVVTCALLVAPAGAQAVNRQLRAAPGQDAAKPFFDSRVAARHAGTRVAASASERSARTRLRDRLGREAVLQVDRLTGTARSIQRLDGTLTGPAAGDRAAVAMSWLRSNRAALGLALADVDALTLADRDVADGSGVTHLRYRQAYEGIPAFDNDVRVNLDRGGRIVNVTGTPLSDLAVDSTEPQLDAAAALRALQRNVGVVRPIGVTSGPTGLRQVTRFPHGDFARLVIFGGADGPRLAWHLTYQATSVAWYDAVVDATTGAVLYRQNLTKFDGVATVFPNYPGAEREDPPKGPANNPIAVNFQDEGWLADDEVFLDGPNALVFSDVIDNNEIDPGEEIDRDTDAADFDQTLTPSAAPTGWTNACDFFDDGDPDWPDPLGQKATCSWDPDADRSSWTVNREQNGVQAFYFVNLFHDHLARDEIGFDSDGDNFEGADRVLVNTDDGAAEGPGGGPNSAHLNNANMSTLPEGTSPTMQMYLFEYDPDPNRFFNFRNINGGDDAGTVWHEYTHGLSNRLVTNADGSGALSSPHAGAMGEAWSDWYALDLLHREPGRLEFDDAATPGEVDIGMYTDAVFTSTRFEPADCPVGTLIEDRCPGSFPFAGEGGFTFGDFARIFALADSQNNIFSIPEVHSDGEIWLQTLWQLRTDLIADLTSETAGSDAAEEIITEAMRLSPPEPSFLDMRNAILAADETINGGANRDLIWTVFANRGMGFFASVRDSSDITPTESFLPPPAPGAGTGTTTGAVTSAVTGLPVPGASVGFGGLNTDPTFPDYFVATTGSNGRYTLTMPAGNYGDLLFTAPGYLPVSTSNVPVTAGGATTRNASLTRNWASRSGGANVLINNALYDNTGAGFGCGLAQLIDQNLGAGWSPFNPASNDPDNPHLGVPTAVIQLPQAITIEKFGLDPGATCGDDETSATKGYEILTSSDGVNFKPALAGSFSRDDAGRLNMIAPTANAGNVRFVKLRLLSQQAGVDFIDFSELAIFGGPPNKLPTGSLRASATTVNPGQTVQFIAAFTDPDSKITGYRWDFDGNGTVEQTTTTPAASFAYPRGGDFTARVSATDFRGGAGTATQTIHVTSAPIAGTPPKRGIKGRLRFRVSCELECTTTAKLTITKKLAKQLGLKKKRTVGSLRRTLAAGSSTRLTIKLTKKAKRALERHGRKSVKATVNVTVRYADGRRDTAKRKVTIRL